MSEYERMSTLCYPYGEGITCVCDGGGKVVKCFPDLGVDQAEWGPAEESEAEADFLDGILSYRTELILASLFFLLLLLVLLGYFLCLHTDEIDICVNFRFLIRKCLQPTAQVSCMWIQF